MSPHLPPTMLQRCQVLREDPDLLEFVAAADRARAVEDCIAAAFNLAPGPLESEDELTMRKPGGIGLLVLDGLMLRRVRLDGRGAGELLGQGDLLRVRPQWSAQGSLPHTVEWRVLERTRIAILDARAAARFAAYPALVGAITARALDRARTLALVMAIVHQPRIEARLHMLMWHLADRWGRVRADGVLLPLRLSHSLLADLVCARRPSVTVALQKLTEHGFVRRVEEGWLLEGDPVSVLSAPAAPAPCPDGA